MIPLYMLASSHAREDRKRIKLPRDKAYTLEQRVIITQHCVQVGDMVYLCEQMSYMQ